ncbi:MAG TPA: DUF6600 domain-containing protein [Chthoniobacterales bacterium]|jgi:hypothetical protein|nr:DUF6600 domain-containing protein [Chthoniobacterales bacterium]
MKRLLFVFAATVLLLPFAPQAKSQDVSVDFFYNNLNGGSWIEVGNYGYCWQPDVAASDSSWRPYADGYWAYTDEGWTWVSYEDFGWATYHYGRWVRLADYGWVWRPGYEWGPAWVSWRFGGGYAGWAPLPPETEVVYESRPLTGHLDVEFDIGPGYYNFVDVRYLGEPVLRSRIVDVNQNVTYINQTVNVTNITYKNKTVYNYGPDLNVVNQYSSRPIQKLKVERQTNVDFSAAAKSGGLTKVQGNALVVAAPTKMTRPAKQIAPPTVKTKLADAKVEKGWSVAGDANAQTQLKEKIKTQDLKKVPPPIATGNTAAAAGASASVAPSASLAPGTAPAEKAKKGKAAQQFQAGATATPSGARVGFPERVKRKGKFGEQAQPGASLSPVESPGATVAPHASDYGKSGEGKRDEKFSGTPPSTRPTAGPEGGTAPGGKRKGFERQNVGPTPGGAAGPGESFNQGGGKHNNRVEQPGTPPTGPQNTPARPQGGPYREALGEHKAEGVNAPPTGGGQMPAGTGQQKEKKHEGKGKAETPTPAPR